VVQVRLDETTCVRSEEWLNREWLETNGRGGYASSTVLNCNTRRYHGLLVANLRMPQGRHVLLSRLEDSIVVGGDEDYLSCCQYPGVFLPREGSCLREFHLGFCPQFRYEMKGVLIRKAVMMVYGKDNVLVRYDIERCPHSATLRVKPFIAYRKYDTLIMQNAFLRREIRAIKNGFTLRPYDGMPVLFVQTSVKVPFVPVSVWYNNFEYSLDRDRGYDWHEDLFLPGYFEIPVKQGTTVIVSASLDMCREPLKKVWDAERKRRLREASRIDTIAEKFENEEDRTHVRNLIRAGQQFLIRTPLERPTIIAGYHWFTDWGRDTLISLPGLAFCSGFSQLGIDILTDLGKQEQDGLLPNYFSDDETQKSYNTVDTALLYFWAVQQMIRYTGNIAVVRDEMWPVMKKILRHYMSGTKFDIYMNASGLLHAGGQGMNLTWMDAVVGGKPVIPRWGYAVEINALWFNAVCFAHELAQKFGDPEYFYHDLIRTIKKSFVDTFWIEKEAYLGDVFCDGKLDVSVRPNQIFAVSLHYSPLEPHQWKGVVGSVMEHLLTPVGLRTLSPEDKEYRGRYEGDMFSRDMAYHQGTVWPWLLAHFSDAYLRVAEDREAAKMFLQAYIRSFIRHHLTEAGVGCISETFDGDPPHRPEGCISQAWSVAGLIRMYSLISDIPGGW